MAQRKRTKSWEDPVQIEHVGILEYKSDLAEVSLCSAGRVGPEGVQSGTDAGKLERIVLHVLWAKVGPTNILALAIWTLKRRTDMVPRSCLPEPNLILNLCQRGSVEVSGYCGFESIQRMRYEATSTPCTLAGLETSTGVAKICADNPGPVGDVFLTPLTGYVQFEPPSLVPV